MTAPLRVLFVVPHPIEGPSTRFRVSQFLPYLALNGVEGELRPLLSSADARIVYAEGRTAAKAAITARALLRRIRGLAEARRFDVAYVLREAFPFGPPLLERALKRAAGRLIFDFDDAVYAPSTAYRNALDRFRDFGKTATSIAMADHVVAGSEYLAAFARAHVTDQAGVTVLPTVVDCEAFSPAPAPRPDRPFTVGWIGTPRGTSYLLPLVGAMRALAARVPEIRFVFVGAEPFDCGDLPVSFPEWRLDREIEDIRGFDVGIMPLADDEEARGKCGFKLIEYMACAVPTVASPVGANRDIVEPGTTGLFAAGEAEWIDAIASIAENPRLRERLSAEGRLAAVARYSTAAIAPRLLDVLMRTAGRRGAR